MTRWAILLATTMAGSVWAEEVRQLDSHVHGVSTLSIAAEGDQLVMALAAPGADIVGFEHPAVSDADRARVEAALSDLANPLQLFAVPPVAGCQVLDADVSLLGDPGFSDVGEHDDHDDHDHGHDDHGHDDHDHSAHGHDDHSDHAHDHHATGHTEFEAEYRLTCANIRDITMIEIGYFDLFDAAQEIDIQVVGRRGARAFEVQRGTVTLDLDGMF